MDVINQDLIQTDAARRARQQRGPRSPTTDARRRDAVRVALGVGRDVQGFNF